MAWMCRSRCVGPASVVLLNTAPERGGTMTVASGCRAATSAWTLSAQSGLGDDVLDGGTGSNFLSGGSGWDTFFIDGRGGGPTWGTITDWEAGEHLSIWGWRPGTSLTLWQDQAGASGWQGATLHMDLDGNGSWDASVTWSGVARAALPQAHEYDGLLWFA
jgi:hypothetical protein